MVTILSSSNSMTRTWYIVLGIWVLYVWQQSWFSSRVFDSVLILPDAGGALPGGAWAGATGADDLRLQSPPIDNDNEDFDPTRIIFLISMGEQARESKLVERFVWSARHRGQWQGYILLLTDAPVERYAGFSHRFLVMNPEAQHFNTSFREDMPYKRFKTHIIDYIDKDTRLNQVRLIYYLDVDNIVGNSLPFMFNDLEIKYNIPGNNGRWLRNLPRIWFFANKYKHLSVQGGQFIVDRYSSEACLLAWRRKIDANVSQPKDQPALHAIRGNGRNQECQIVTMLPKPHLFFPANSTIHRAVEQIQNGEVLSYPTLVHIKNSCNVTASIDARVEETYVQDIVRNPEFSKKIHVQPDQKQQS